MDFRKLLTGLLILLSGAWYAIPPAQAVVSVQVQHRGCPSGGGTVYTSYPCPLAGDIGGTQAGNTLLCLAQVGNTANTISMTDEFSDVFTLDKRFNDANQNYAIFHATPTAGTKLITLNVSSTGAGFQDFSCSENNNITGLDLCSAGASGTGTAVTAGSLTPTQTADVIIQITGNESGTTPSVPGHGVNSNITWVWQQADTGYVGTNLVAQGVQQGQYNSVAAINPAMTLGTSVAWGSVACAYKTGVAGSNTRANGYISSIEHYNMAGAANGQVIAIPFDTADNTGVVALIDSTAGGTNPRIASIVQTGTGSANVWIKGGDVPDASGSGYISIWLCPPPGCTFGDDSKLTINLIATNTFAEAELIAYGGIGFLNSPLDTGMTSSNGTCVSGFCSMTGTQTVGATPIPTITLTPGTANGVTFVTMGVNSPQIRGVSSGLSDVAFSTQEAGINELDENNGRMRRQYTTATAGTISWVTAGTPLNGWQVAAINLLIAPASAGGGTGAGLLLKGVSP